jgi:hypothetical protein
MQISVCNPYKARLETIDIEFTDKNTTWFDDCDSDDDIYTITDIDGGLLIRKFGYRYPVLIYDLSRAGINKDRNQALWHMRNIENDF